MRARKAFTLLELTVVLVLLALVLAVVGVSLKRPYQRARLQDAVERMAHADRLARDHARRFQHAAQLEIDLETGRVATFADDTPYPTSQLQLGSGVKIDRVFLPQRRLDYGQVSIPVSVTGSSPTYALRMTTTSGDQKWLLFTGTCGQQLTFDDEHEIQELLVQISSRAHAD